MSIRDSLRMIAAEKRIGELGGAVEALMEELDELAKRVTEIEEKATARPVQSQGPQPRPVERR